MLGLLLACVVVDSQVPAPAAGLNYLPMEAPALLRRMSLDLRGVVPSVDEYAAVEADEDQLEVYLDAFLDSPDFEERLVHLFDESWHTRVDVFDIRYYDFFLNGDEEYRFERSVGEEPLRLLAYVGARDLPWTEVLTAEHTMADEMLGEIFPVDYPEDESGWQPVPYNDGRPGAGVIATNGLWWRYYTNSFNMSRSRAAAMFRLLICTDFLTRPVSLSVTASLLDADATQAAVREEPYCLSCHAMVEPVAATMFGFWTASQFNVEEATHYHPEREPMGPEILEVEPAWFGQPVSGVEELAAVIAQDTRFHRCTSETMASALWRRPVKVRDVDTITELLVAFEDADLRLKGLIRAVIQTPAYQAEEVEAEDTGLVADEVTRRMMSPAQLVSATEDLTGFRWTWKGYDQWDNDIKGYRVLAGGVNGLHVKVPQQLPGLTWAAAAKRHAEAAAQFVVNADLAIMAEDRRLFGMIEVDTQPGDGDFEDQVQDLSMRVLGRTATDDEVAEIVTLWEASKAVTGANEAWSAVLSMLLRDPEFLSY